MELFFSVNKILNQFSDPPTVNVLQPSYGVTVSNSVTLQCVVTSSLPVTSVYWQRNVGGSVTTITSNTNTNKYSGSTANAPSLTILSAELGDTGSYTCFASNSAGTGQSTVTTLTVTGSRFSFALCSLILIYNIDYLYNLHYHYRMFV